MKGWLAIVSGASALVALWALPPSRLETPPVQKLPEQIRYESVEGEIRRAHGALRALRWSDSLSALAVRAAVDGVAFSPPRGEGLEAAEVRPWEERLRAALAGIEPRDPDMVVGVFWQPPDHAAVPGVPSGIRMREVTFVGERDGTPYCIRAVPYTERGARVMLRYSGDVGPCRLYAAYGTPGERIQEWLDASALRFARVAVPSFAADFALTALPPRDATRLFGASRPQFADQNLAVQACLAGRAEACARAVTDPELIAPRFGDEAWLVANSPASSFGGDSPDAPFGWLDDGLLYEIEARFGSDAFARFWTSAEPVAEAFEAAFGLPLGEWVLRWIEGHVGLYRAGPSLPWSSLGLSLLALAALAGVATGAAVRRRVG
jgi:hypothetical protein